MTQIRGGRGERGGREGGREEWAAASRWRRALEFVVEGGGETSGRFAAAPLHMLTIVTVWRFSPGPRVVLGGWGGATECTSVLRVRTL